MSTATIHVSAQHKLKENLGCYAISITTSDSKKVREKTGQFESHSKNITQLSTLLHSLSLLETTSIIEDVTLVTEFSLVKIFTDGSVFSWHSKNWTKPDGTPNPDAHLWEELFTQVVNYNINFVAPEPVDEVMKLLKKRVKSEAFKVEKMKKLDKKPDEIIKNTNEKEEIEEKEGSATPLESGGILHINEVLVAECEVLFQEIGLDVTTAVTMFLKESLRKQSVSLELKL